MVSLLKVELVQYQCSCQTWLPLCQLYFCHKCDTLKCNSCLHEEMDIIFCPNCMESNSENMATNQRKFRCASCNNCPMCENILVARGLGNGLYYVQCTSCHWTSRDSGIPDQASYTDWPEHCNPIEKKLGEIMQWMKDTTDKEKNEQTLEQSRRLQLTKRSNLGVLANDRFALNSAYNMRRKAHNVNKSPLAETFVDSTSKVPELDASIFTASVDAGSVPTLAQIIRQPLCGAHKSLFPAKVKLISRRYLRCTEPEMGLLYRGELNSSTVKPKMACFSFESVPEVRILRPVDFAPGRSFSLFLIVSNNSSSSAKVLLRGVEPDGPRCVDCSDFELTIPLPHRDNIADIDDYLQNSIKTTGADDERVVMIKRHRYGIRVDCKPLQLSPLDLSPGKSPYVRLSLAYNYPDEKPNKWLNLSVCINLHASAMAETRQ